MRGLLPLLVPLLTACGQGSHDAKPPSPEPAELPAEAQISKLPDLVPLPKDQAQLDRMILAGYTPHADHLHAPGVEQCPMSEGTRAVM